MRADARRSRSARSPHLVSADRVGDRRDGRGGAGDSVGRRAPARGPFRVRGGSARLHAGPRSAAAVSLGVSPRRAGRVGLPGRRRREAVPGSDPTLSFNLSHTRQLVACAIAAGAPVGIDVERAARLADAGAIAGRYFSPFEVASLARCRDDAHKLRFLELWTLKESFVKAVGVGLTMPLDSMSFGLDESTPSVFQPPAGYTASEWHFALFEPPGSARMAVAIQAPAPPRIRRTRSRLGRAGPRRGRAFPVASHVAQAFRPRLQYATRLNGERRRRRAARHSWSLGLVTRPATAGVSNQLRS